MPFRREKLLHSLLMALGGQPEHYTHAESLTDNIIGRLLRKKTGAVIDRADLIAICKTTLRRYDRSAHLRYLAEHG